jgi:hypothetical protein
MNSRTFNRRINDCSTPKRKGQDRLIDVDKLAALPPDTRKEMARFVIKCRVPLLAQLAVGLDKSWLASMGYMYRTKSQSCPQFEFIHTSEHTIR